jgi:hypothetical protein
MFGRGLLPGSGLKRGKDEGRRMKEEFLPASSPAAV